MCKRLRDILFPTNVKGLDERCVNVRQLDATAGLIVFTGDYLKVSYHYWSGHPYNSKLKSTSRIARNNGRFIIDARGSIITDVYFQCINVTSLTLNDQQLI